MTKRNIIPAAFGTSEKYFQELLENIRLIAVILDVNGHVKYCNPYFLSMTGYSADEVTGADWFNIMIPKTDLSTKKVFLKGMKSGNIIEHFANPILKKNKELRYFIWNNTILRDASGTIIGTASIGEDTTEQKRIEEAREASELQYHALVEQAMDAFFVHDFEGRFIEVNQRACENLGYSKEELLSMSVTDVEQDFDLKKAQAEWKKIKPGSPFTLFGHQKRKDGTIFPVEVRFGCSVWKEQKLFLGMVRDITESKKIKDALLESEEKYRSFFSNSLDAILLTGHGGAIIAANPAACEMFGYTEIELIKSGRKGIVDANDPRLTALLSEREKTGKVKAEMTLLRKNGEKFQAEIKSVVFSDAGGNRKSSMTIRDITESKEVETQLRESEALLRESQEIAHMGSFVFDFHSNTWTSTKVLDDMFGIDSTYNRTMEGWLDIIHDDDRQMIADYIKNDIIMQGQVFEKEFRIIRQSDKAVRWLWSRANLERDSAGNPTGVHGTSLDITDRKVLEEALQKSEREFRLLAEAMPQIVWITRADGWNIFFNQQWTVYTGLTLEESHGHGWNKPFHPDDQQMAWDTWQNAIKHNGTYSIECRLRRKDGVYTWWLIRGLPIMDSDGIIQKWFGTCTDINELKIAEEKILKLNEELELRVAQRTSQLEALNKELETFTYSVSHDLKAPLRGIDGYSKLLIDTYAVKLDEEAMHFLTTIRRSTRQMNLLIDDLLEYSKLERSELRSEKIKIKSLISYIISTYTEELNSSKFIVNENVPDIEILADSKGLTIALRNIIENAIKFATGKPDPLINIVLEETEASWKISVQDNGIGFDMKYHQKIFEIFQRLHRADEFPGTGIGLAMVTKAMNRMNGRVWAEANPGTGSTFYLEIAKTK